MKKAPVSWDLKKHFYQSAKDPQIEADMRMLESACESFAARYGKDKRHLDDPKALASALKDYEELVVRTSSVKPLLYFHYRKSLNASDEEAGRMMSLLTQRTTNAANKIVFFDVELAKVSEETKKKFLAASELSAYRYFLTRLFAWAPHTLSTAEEKIMNLKSQPASDMWSDMFDRINGRQVLTIGTKKLPLPEAQNRAFSLPKKDRRIYGKVLNEAYKGVAEIAENEINAVIINKKINDGLRSFEKPYDSTLLGYENTQSELSGLMTAVEKNIAISREFYALKAKLLGEKKLTYIDRKAPYASINAKFDWKEAVGIVRESFEKVDPEFATIFDRLLEAKQIDVYPKKGKEGGAYCSSSLGSPTLVFLNHVDDFDSLMTLAHEMGHAIHAELSKSQPPLYQSHTISVAEVASTLFENFAFQEVYEKLTDKEKIVALHDRIEDAMSTIFRQIACFKFEEELHATIRAEGYVKAEKMADMHNKNMQWYLGPTFKLEREDGYFFTQWGHIRRFFYVYSYAYGELVSSTLYRLYKKDKADGVKKIKAFLSAGGSMSPADIWKAVGLDATKEEFWTAGLAAVRADLEELKRLTTKAKKTKKGSKALKKAR